MHVLNILFEGYLRKTSKYPHRIFDLTLAMSIVDCVTINMETLRKDR